MKNLPIGASIITLVALFTVVAPFLADWNATHIYNARWTPHAKFHTAQTMLLGAGLGLGALWFAWRRGGDRQSNLLAAAVFAALYWITQAASIAFPGTAFADPEFAAGSAIPVQPVIDVIALSLVGVGYYIESRQPTEQNIPSRARV